MAPSAIKLHLRSTLFDLLLDMEVQPGRRGSSPSSPNPNLRFRFKRFGPGSVRVRTGFSKKKLRVADCNIHTSDT